jgi:DNA polymerase III delta prime subunit
MELLQQITPRDLTSFVGNKMVVSTISKYIQQVKGRKDAGMTKNIMCLLGPDGCGKTTLCSLLLQKYDFQVLEIGKDILTNDNIKTMIENFTNNTTIEHYMLKKQKIVFIDDIDLLLCIDRNLVSKITSCNKILKKKGICVLVTCNSNIDKKLFSETEAEMFRLSYPSCKDAFSYIMHRFDAQGTDYDMEQLLQVVSKHKGNIRESVLNLHNSKVDLECKVLERAFKDMNQFEMAKCILGKSNTCKELDHLVKGDVGNLPYIVYENLPAEVDANYKTNDLLDMYLEVNKHFSDAVSFDEHAYTCMDWGLLHYANILRVKSVFCNLDKLEPKATKKNVTYKFSQMRSKASHKRILGKKVKVASHALQASEKNLMVATDTLLRNSIGSSGSAKPTNKSSLQDMTCFISTYEKYFT